jgi:hypothetical protein
VGTRGGCLAFRFVLGLGQLLLYPPILDRLLRLLLATSLFLLFSFFSFSLACLRGGGLGTVWVEGCVLVVEVMVF